MWEQAGADRALVVVRRIAAAPEWPVAAAAGLSLFAMLEVTLRGQPVRSGNLSGVLLLVLCATVPLALARTHVFPVAVATTAATFAILATAGWLPVAVVAAELTVLYLLGRNRPRWMALPVLAPFAIHAIGRPFVAGQGGRLLALLMLWLAIAAVATGAIQRARGEAVRRADSQRAIEDSLLEHAARGERARIARELHDVVAHHISVIAVQAETARLTTAGLPAEGAKRLVAIGDTARSALTEMRRLLGVLREDAGAEPTRAPQPGLEQLNELLDEARDLAGTSTRLIVHGRVEPLGPGVELTAYRIIQEALTNVRRHAPGAAVDVQLDYTADALYVRVRDNGPGPGEVVSLGHGLLGMRERAATVGGTVRTGSAPSNGFLVEAVLPTGRTVT